MRYNEVKGDLIKLAKAGEFDVVAHGCNCFCVMGRGVAPQMATAFGCNRFRMEDKNTAGDINKLGQIDWEVLNIAVGNSEFDIMDHDLTVVNVYSQYTPNVALKPLDYEALTLGLRKINHIFKGKHIGLPQIGAGLAGGDWTRIKQIIQTELRDMDVTVVIYNK
jgi:O-acetyl-ADP-ribose deacetylase (regulator of RNase III)